MYLISGTLFFITSFFIFVGNYVLSDMYYGEMNGFISIIAFISFLMGIVFYYAHNSQINNK